MVHSFGKEEHLSLWTQVMLYHSATVPGSTFWPLEISNMGVALISINLCWFGSAGPVTPSAWLHLGHSSLEKVSPLDCIAVKLEICLAAVPAEKYFQGKYLKH